MIASAAGLLVLAKLRLDAAAYGAKPELLLQLAFDRHLLNAFDAERQAKVRARVHHPMKAGVAGDHTDLIGFDLIIRGEQHDHRGHSQGDLPDQGPVQRDLFQRLRCQAAEIILRTPAVTVVRHPLTLPRSSRRWLSQSVTQFTAGRW
jgi:hypothetical protein